MEKDEDSIRERYQIHIKKNKNKKFKNTKSIKIPTMK